MSKQNGTDRITENAHAITAFFCAFYGLAKSWKDSQFCIQPAGNFDPTMPAARRIGFNLFVSAATICFMQTVGRGVCTRIVFNGLFFPKNVYL